MSIPGATTPLLLRTAATTSTYNVERSLYFTSVDTTYFTKTFASAGNQKTFTFAFWVKRHRLGPDQYIWTTATAGSTTTPRGSFRFNTSDQLVLSFNPTGSLFYTLTSAARFRDTNAWMHIVVSCDTTQATDTDRTKIYVNNVLQTVSGTYVPQNTDLPYNSTVPQQIGRNVQSGADYLDGGLADIHFIDGQALTPSAFTEVNITTSKLDPKAYSGSYGTNGYRLLLADPASTTTIAADSSGNSNNWTATNFPTSSGVPIFSIVDSPSSYGSGSAGGDVRGNYATIDRLQTLTTVAGITRSNLRHTSTTNGQTALGSIGVSSGKWYWEIITSAGSTETQVGVHTGITASTTYSLGSNNVTYGIRFDADAGTLDYTTNGSSWTSIATGLTSGPYFPYFRNGGTTVKNVDINFGQSAWVYAAPSGYVALCDTNLPTPAISNPSTVLDVALWTGTGSSLNVTGLGFSPDLVWIKSRSAATTHAVYDTNRGVQLDLATPSLAAETTETQGLTAFNSDGFTVGTLAKVNTSAATYAGWCWDGGSSTVTNTSGTISSQVRANASAGFSIVTYTGTGVAGTVGHGLNVAPSFIIARRRNQASSNWLTYHASLGAGNIVQLHSTAASSASGVWNSTAPTSTVFSIGTTSTINSSGDNFVAYCFSAVNSYSAAGSYTGNGSTGGPFINLGFRPAVLLIKMTSSTGNWVLLDYKREGYNVDNDGLFPNTTDAEGVTDLLDLTSTGFKIRSTDASVNTSSGTYIYYAWAEAAFKNARAR